MPPRPLATSEAALAVSQPTPAVPFAPVLAPRAVEQLQRLKGDMRIGLPVILTTGGTHETRDEVLVAAIETLTQDRYSAMTALGAVDLLLTRRRAVALGAQSPGQAETLRLRVPPAAGLDWVRTVAGQVAPRRTGQDMHDAPAGLPIVQAGNHLHEAAIALAKAAQLLPSALAVPLGASVGDTIRADLTAMAAPHVLDALDEMRGQARVSTARLPMEASGAGRVHVFRPDDGGIEHYAIEIGAPDRAQPVTVRLHSACFTGDVLGSLKCDCGPQLRAAMAAMAASGGGVLLYLNQEGRGIGLANKMRAYALQDAGLDTVEANHWLGFEDDQRDFRIGAQMLRRMGIARVRLMTNNPGKVASLVTQGIDVAERVPLQVGRNVQNAHYLATKAAKSGHLL